MESPENQKISFHLFPQNMEKRMKWLKALQLENYKPLKSAAICSAHFKNTDYELNHTNRKLKKDAVPHLLEAEIQSADQNHTYSDQNTYIEEKINNKTEKNNEENIVTITEDNMDTYHNNTRIVHRSTSITPDRILNSPIKTRMREAYTREIKAVKRKLCVSRYEHKRTQKKLVTLKNVLKDLQKRNLLTAEECDILQHLDAGTQELVKREISMRKNLPVSRIYKPSLRQFALSLHYYSPKAYNYVRNITHNT